MSVAKVCKCTFGKHKSPLPATAKTSKEYRKINADQAKIPQFLLIEGDYICSSCRSIVEKSRKPQKDSTPHALNTDQIKISHNIYCANPFESHPRKRQIWPEHFVPINEALFNLCQSLNLTIKLGDRVCVSCHQRIKRFAYPDEVGKFCKDPFGRHADPKKKTPFNSFRKITADQLRMCRAMGKELDTGDYLCSGCRKLVSGKWEAASNQSQIMDPVSDGMEVDDFVMPEVDPACTLVATPQADDADSNNMDTEDEDDNNHLHSGDSDTEEEFTHEETDFSKLKKLLEILREPVPTLKEIQSAQYVDTMYKKLQLVICNVLSNVSRRKCKFSENPCNSCKEYVDGLVMKFGDLDTKTDKYLLLTCTPGWVTIKSLCEIFGISKRMAGKVSSLRNSLGPFSAPDPKIGRPLSTEIRTAVINFYLSPDNGNISPCQRDVVITGRGYVNGEKTITRSSKHFLYMTMKQLFFEFTNQHPHFKVSISKFASLKPKQCVWGYRMGFQKTCLCIYHTNCELLLDAIGESGRLHNKIDLFYCGFHAPCLLGFCDVCPQWHYLHGKLEDIDDVEYWWWGSEGTTYGIELMKKSSNKTQFVDFFQAEFRKDAEHHFIYMKQRESINEWSNSVSGSNSTAIVTVDFGQNYSFVLPNEVASYHWSHRQATVHPFVLRCCANGLVQEYTFTVISDHLHHNATSFHAFWHVVLTNHIKVSLPFINYIVFISDSTSAQYRNVKNFVNLANHKKDYDIDAKWVFSAAGHGKGSCDRASAIAKRLTRQESIRRKSDFITNPREMADFLSNQNRDHCKRYIFISNEQVSQIIQSGCIEERYLKYQTVKGTMLYHDVTPADENTLICKKYSSSTIEYKHVFVIHESNLLTEELYKVGEYVAFVYDRLLVVGMIQSVINDGNDCSFKIMAMKKCEKGAGYKWLDTVKFLTVAILDLLCKLEAPTTTSGRVYTFKLDEVKNAKFLHDEFLKKFATRHKI